MSIGFFLDENTPVMWRRPMRIARSSSFSRRPLGDLDTLVVDMPPGAAAVAISLGSFFPEPRRSSSQPAPRGTAGGRARGADGSEDRMRLLGVVENMSYLSGSGKSSSARAGRGSVP